MAKPYKNQMDKVIDRLTTEIDMAVGALDGESAGKDNAAHKLILLSRLVTLHEQRWALIKSIIENNGKYDG